MLRFTYRNSFNFQFLSVICCFTNVMELIFTLDYLRFLLLILNLLKISITWENPGNKKKVNINFV